MTQHKRITRRNALLGGAGAIAAISVLRNASAAEGKPDILFIMADDLGYADVSCYGRREYKTESVDRLAVEGVRFLQAYASSAVCSPSRVALITGRYPGRLAVGLDEPGVPPGVGLPPEHPTLPSLLKKAGYSTALVGKWHMGGLPNFGPGKSGYDQFYGVRSGGSDYFHHDRDLWDGEVLAHEHGYMTALLGDRAVALVERMCAAPNPFLLSLHFTAPHWPWEGPNDQAESDRIAAKPGGLSHFDGGTLKTYSEMVLAMDREIARVLDVLDRTGRAKNTIVVFTSDNGGERFSDTWPFTGKKTELLEGGLRVPAIVRWPERIAPGSTTEQVSVSMDWLPTLLAAIGTRPESRYPSDGVNFLDVLTGRKAPKARKVFWRYNSLGQEAVRDGDFKYLKIMDNTFLFNVVEDPLERANLKERYPDIFQRLAKDWQAWNKTLLPYSDRNSSWTASSSMLADHFGAPGGISPSRSESVGD